MAEHQWFYNSPQEWDALCQRLKQTPCPHCQVLGTLIRHGSLLGYGDQKPHRKTMRGYRLFCSNRHNRPGCGRTISVFRADKIQRRSLSTGRLWRFLRRAVTGTIGAAIEAVGGHLSERTWRRLCKRFGLAQSRIRTVLTKWCEPPVSSSDASLRPEAHVLQHLQSAFAEAECPIAAFQMATETFFL